MTHFENTQDLKPTDYQSSANLLKETEKAIQVAFAFELNGESRHCNSSWIPKSQITIDSIEEGKIRFTPKNDWILKSKINDYMNYVARFYGKRIYGIANYNYVTSF